MAENAQSWGETAKVKRKRKKSGEVVVVVEVTDPDAEAKKFDRTRLLPGGREDGHLSQCGESIKPVHCRRRCLIPQVAGSRTQ